MGTIPERKPFIQSLKKHWYDGRVQEVAMLRLDVVHPEVSGNKWYKLKKNIAEAINNNHTSILTFGGGYSNHLVATAKAAQYFGLKAIGIVRGDYSRQLTPTLEACIAYDMQIEYVSYEEYKNKGDEEWLRELSVKYDNPYIIPEGGANKEGVSGAAGICKYVPDVYTHICVSVGSGTTYAGIARSTPQQTIGYAPIRGGAYLNEEIHKKWGIEHAEVLDNWHFGGFGKHTDELISFMNDFHLINNIPLDVVYTSKMMYGIREQIMSGYFPEDSRILCVHTGGLQGNSNVSDRLVY